MMPRRLPVSVSLPRLRFGGHSYGMANYLEKALDWVDGERVQAWADQRFCAANAACLLSTRVPPRLELELAHGPPPALDQHAGELSRHLVDEICRRGCTGRVRAGRGRPKLRGCYNKTSQAERGGQRHEDI